MRIILRAAVAWLMASAGGAAWAVEKTPLTFSQPDTIYNFQSQRGMPISTNMWVPPGSDGRMPATNSSWGSVNPATTNQFSGLVVFGGSSGLTLSQWQSAQTNALLRGTNAYDYKVDVAMGLPAGRAKAGDDSTICLVLHRAQVGAPFINRQVSYAFGDIVMAPLTDENGVLLPANTPPSVYWMAEPYSPRGHTNDQYYWSPHAGVVFASQDAQVFVTWRKATSYAPADVPTSYVNVNGSADGVGSFWTNGPIYLLYTVRYVVSSGTVKPPQKMYWTEGSFKNTGMFVQVPPGQVNDVHVVFNREFPRSVAQPYDASEQTSINGTNTLWYENMGGMVGGQIHAYNAEGRVFVELLGEMNPDGVTRRFLGFEIAEVSREPEPTDIAVGLGTQLTPYAGGVDDLSLYPSPINQSSAQNFYYRQAFSGTDRPILWATTETHSLNDLQVYWLVQGVAGLQWPKLFGRYHQSWPADASAYSHYLRPAAATRDEAALTAVQLPSVNAPKIAYQDPLDRPRAFLTPGYSFYTWLDAAHPAHRTLLQYMSGDQVSFERVFSWLDVGIKANALALLNGATNTGSVFNNSVAVNLADWNPNTLTLAFTNAGKIAVVPQCVSCTAAVGDSLRAPPGELGAAGSDYWAGYISQTNGTSFNPLAYLDPFQAGFDAANLGAIIPVNAIPGKNILEVWWFRRNQADAGRGFAPAYWPTAIARYTLGWPANPREIILAADAPNAGSGPLGPLEANGSIYYQNDPRLPGYNPNEEHALLLGGRAYALRDDLNVTAPDHYTSDPFVLLSYTRSDGRPAMSVFKVLREKPEAGIIFDYVVEAGSILQPPMPLPLLEPPVADFGGGAMNASLEVLSPSGDLPTGWTDSQASGTYGNYQRFTHEDRKHNFWVYRGLHAGLPPLAAGHYNPTSNTLEPLSPATALLNQPFSFYIHTSRRTDSLTMSISPDLPDDWDMSSTTNGLLITGTPLNVGSNLYTVVIQDTGDQSLVTNTLPLTVTDEGTNIVTQGPLSVTSTNQYTGTNVTYTGRPPHLAQAPARTNSFTMRFYYKNQPGFAWPTNITAATPAAGQIVPYLRPRNSTGDPASKSTPALDIVYRPVWPGAPPVLRSGETLTEAMHQVAAVRGQSSVQVLYQQSVGLNITSAPVSVILHDPTVRKTSKLDQGGAKGLKAVPASVQTDSYQGRVYFPNLPPHLAQRCYFDPSSSNLVFQGEFVDELVGDKYLHLNVLRDADLAAVQGLCPATDTDHKSKWDALVAGLSVPVFLFTNGQGRYVADTNRTVSFGVGNLVAINDSDQQVDSYALSACGPGWGYVTYITGNGHNPAHEGEPVSVYVARVMPPLYSGQVKVLASANPLNELVTFQHSPDLAGCTADYEYDWRIAPPVDGQPPTTSPAIWTLLAKGTNLPRCTLGGYAGIQVLGDNYVAVRYRATSPLANPACTNWSDWAAPQLAEGWIKRVLAGINPFNQRTTDLFNNPANTTASIISQAGHRWEGDVALNADTINNHGLIEIYETVLNRGRNISIGAGINYGPANDALLLAAGYLNDLYMMLGNDAWADAANPTIGIGTADRTYGNIATALFAFKGEAASLLEEELALLRGRDDFLTPGTILNPVYNRLYWNYTRGIDAGEVIYALNYNILDQNHDGVVNAADAAILYPQGHGDAYGHYLTATKNYYSLLMNPSFDWVPRVEAVTVLGAAVSVDYQDERKFAAAAAAVARAGRQIFDLTWRQNYQPGTSRGWDSFSASRTNLQHTYVATGATNYVTRHWGLDHWAARTGLGAYVHWMAGNAILPDVDPNPGHEGIQKVDRTTVPELQELCQLADQIQTDMDHAEGGITPLGIPQDSIPFDINPLQVTGPNPQTHFEQIYQRAVGALNNAVVAFDDAQNVTEMMRSEEDSLANFQAGVIAQELAYNNQLLELYGSPYPDDMGPGKTWSQDYTGPDTTHWMYVENPESTFNGGVPNPTVNRTFRIDVQKLPDDWVTHAYKDFNFITEGYRLTGTYTNYPTNYIEFNVDANGFIAKPVTWTSRRASPGKIQQAISGLITAQNKLRQELSDTESAKKSLDKSIEVFNAQATINGRNLYLQYKAADLQQDITDRLNDYNAGSKWLNLLMNADTDIMNGLGRNNPTMIIFGMANGGDQIKLGLQGVFWVLFGIKYGIGAIDAIAYSAVIGENKSDAADILGWSNEVRTNQLDVALQNQVMTLASQLSAVRAHFPTINQRLRELDDVQRACDACLAQGNRIQAERETFRQRAAAVVQGYRTRDAAFRIFQNEKLERYKTLFDLAAEYAFMAANAYDYETGLLNTDQGRAFLSRLMGARALGVVQNGQPQYAGSNTGDPGLSSALAEMKADWDVLKGRLGFNNADGYGTVASLRAENHRLLPGPDDDVNWRDLLNKGRMADLLADSDVQRYCMQIDDGSGLPVPGIVLTFSTVIADGYNLFGQPLAQGDHAYSSSSFATKIFAVGVDFDGYIGMDNPAGPATNAVGNPNALAATPYVYLIPVGVDSMRTPPLGDTTGVRTWTVDDLTIPLPFNISASDFSTTPFYQSSDSLSEPLFSVRKHQAFRPVSTVTSFEHDIYSATGGLQPSQYTNRRLIGRSVWNSKWKLVIPGKTLLSNPNQGLDVFIKTVTDVKLHFVTYSYAGN